jgi:polyphosphate kinase 2 (PPK2 family)
MTIDSKDFRVKAGEKVDLQKWPTEVEPFYKSKEHYQKSLEENVHQLYERQRLHYASARYALLIIFQGMDASGKDGAVRHVMSGVNPQGCEVFSFKQPSAEELEQRVAFPNAGALVSSIARIMRKCSSCASTRKCCAARGLLPN